MKIRHRFSFWSSPRHRAVLSRAHVDVPDSGLISVILHEDDARWEQASMTLASLDAIDFVDTVFTQREIDAAQWCDMAPSWHHGYPQPEDDHQYLETTYDLRHYCSGCGVGPVQRAPFRMTREPRWAGHDILQLNWVFGEYFVTPELYGAVFAPHGVGSRAVQNRLGADLDSVVQLVVDEKVSLVTDGLSREVCKSCSTEKYHYVSRGKYPPLARTPSSVIVRSTEYFGSGGSAAQIVIVSQALVRELLRRKIKGVLFTPLLDA